ncbi:small ribosomal subunit protein mS27-like [Tubulanus polymorphus]|uniref:small ribosomal subunit protein mS27-like n=1 Tax=Tubulanus polymorphus TaxID=672921 RepID=UPI003DA5E406
MAASMSIRAACRLNTIFRHRIHSQLGCQKIRTLLSSAYSCDELWAKRSENPILSAINANEFIVKLHEKYEKEKLISAIDIDILANNIENVDFTEIDFTENLFKRFRSCQGALDVLDSTPYALVRGYINMKQTDRFLDMLQDKFGYGIFLDHYSGSLLMDYFIKQENYYDAAQVAYEFMLQEDYTNQTVKLLSLYSSYKHLINPLPEVVDEESGENTEQKSDETIYMRVPYVRNPSFDDHFDLVEDRHVLGKTLHSIGNHGNDDIIHRSCRLIGLGLWEKISDGFKILREYISSNMKHCITQDALDRFKTALDEIEAQPVDPELTSNRGIQVKLTPEEKTKYQEEFEEIRQSLQKANLLSTENLDELIETLVKSELPKLKAHDITAQEQLFARWEITRQEKLNEQLENYRYNQRKKELIKQMLEIKEKEELLNYYERIHDIQLAASKAPKIEVEEKHDEIEEDVKKYLKIPRKRKVYEMPRSIFEVVHGKQEEY